MPRYIDADKIDYRRNCRGCSGFWCDNCEDYIAERNQIDAIPTADVQEMKHGMWKQIYNTYPRYVCTSCDHLFNNKGFKYCPNCGARMDGKE